MLWQIIFHRAFLFFLGMGKTIIGGSGGGHSNPSAAIIQEHSVVRNGPVTNGDINREGKGTTTKELLCIRHGVSLANEFLSQYKWGDPTFRDDPTLIDARLSETGIKRTQSELPQQLLHQEDLRAFLVGSAAATEGIASAAATTNESSDTKNLHPSDGVELVIVSPLTRCLQTYMYGVEPVLLDLLTKPEEKSSKLPIPVLALPLLRERVYTASDTGRPISVLEDEFPSIDFSECHKGIQEESWWYTGNESEYKEWRPHGDGQWYAVPGEPQAVFDRRMEALKEWLSRRKEKKILVVAHWGVLNHLSDGVKWKNSEAKIIRLDVSPS